MSLISTLARMEAVESGRAQPLATVRHRRLSERPLVVVPLTTAGEAGAPLGALVGTDPEEPRLLVVPQPRDRDLRFAFLADLAEEILPYIDSFTDVVEAAERNEVDPETGKKVKVEVELCADAPQLIVPSRAGIEYVRLLGRSTRFRRTAEQDPETPFPAPPRVPLLGRWLTHFGERARVPGSSLLLSATDLLNRHWATGQSSLEDQHLGALLAWIDAYDGEPGSEGALRAETGRVARRAAAVPAGRSGYELPARHTPRTDPEAVGAIALVVRRLLDRGGAAVSERSETPVPLTPDRIAVGTAHRDQAAAVRAALADLGVTGVTVDTANRLQGREYDVTVVLHPLSGRPDATAFHLETGRLCVLASRHRHACIVVCRAGVAELLDEHPSTDPVRLGVAVSFPDGWEANHAVLSHLEEHRVTWAP
ncbi:hypothetical protein STANM309S_06752 [Streptomyces tanashiensis]